MDETSETQKPTSKRIKRLHLLGVVLTIFGVGLFAYLIYSIGFREIWDGIKRFGFDGFAVIVVLFFVRLLTRAYAWTLTVHPPYTLTLKDTVPAMMIGEAMSSTIPLGFFASGTAKAIAVRNRIPLVAGLSSVATENLFYSLTTGLFLIAGAVVLLLGFALDENVALTLNIVIGALSVFLVLGVMMVMRQWHFASWICNWAYKQGILHDFLGKWRVDVRRFEDLIYGFYRHFPRRFVPLCLLQMTYHLFGIVEVAFILYRLTGVSPGLLTAFLLESISRFITVIFKLIPFTIGVDEAGAQFIGETVSLAAGVGVTLAIIRRGRIFFWTAVGMIVIIKRGLSLSEITKTIRH
ncbi:MAG: lysylphosphatidylglycerol synthase transmembrane domain-containing protein [Pyrinomonadaceae bacterium]